MSEIGPVGLNRYPHLHACVQRAARTTDAQLCHCSNRRHIPPLRYPASIQPDQPSKTIASSEDEGELTGEL
ncbi:MAG: hypothetical protein FRX48_00273 [Lasallia pustulata]|uniref:Uncharacterized protein n=1 Tax=Lasallia pustulata TaxID=136370 RepID=A0A5M8Q2G6_9LECA|nr:MAG: hypothetical protein FRX48_00273 [Lasallia pustulata]